MRNKPELKELPGKTMLIGISFFDADGNLLEQKQLWGKVVQADEDMITVCQSNGEIYSIPSDLRSTEEAAPGEYRLRSTGEIVKDPDYLSTWTVHKGSSSNIVNE